MERLLGALLYLGAFFFIIVLITSELIIPMWELAIWIIIIVVLVLVFKDKKR
nr:MAG TPA: hypothetical protein [Caudoviricetes sp.]